jgi:cell shape-determining protein MreC
VQSAGATILRPFEIASERVAQPFRDVYGYFASLVHVKSENEKLKTQVNELRQKVLLGEAARAQNAQLRRQLRFVDSPLFPSDYTAVNTRIIGWRNEFDERVVIATTASIRRRRSSRVTASSAASHRFPGVRRSSRC